MNWPARLWCNVLGRPPLVLWRNSQQARGLRAACCRCPSGQLAGQEVPAFHSSLSPIHAAASCEHHSGSKLPSVHGRWPRDRADLAQANP
jgi:hypothetical protein